MCDFSNVTTAAVGVFRNINIRFQKEELLSVKTKDFFSAIVLHTKLK